MAKVVLKGLMYRFKRGCVPSYASSVRYRYAVPVEDWRPEMQSGDCLLVDRNGRPDVALSHYPVPVCREALGDDGRPADAQIHHSVG